MNSNEMKLRGQISLDAMFNYSAPGITDEEWSLKLTESQQEFIEQRLSSTRDISRETVNETEKLRVSFSALVNSNNLTGITVSTHYPNAYFIQLPVDHFYTLLERVDITITDPDSCYLGQVLTNIRVLPISEDYYAGNIENPFKKPYDGLVWRLNYNRANESNTVQATGYTTNPKIHEIITDGLSVVVNDKITYLRRPKPIIVTSATEVFTIEGYDNVTYPMMNCELDPWTHEAIIDITVNKIAASIRDLSRYQTSQVEVQRNEM